MRRAYRERRLLGEEEDLVTVLSKTKKAGNNFP